MKQANPQAAGLCQATQPDGKFQRCIRFHDHPGPHQTFVAEWSDGDACSHRRQSGAVCSIPAAAARRNPLRRPSRMRAW